MKEILSGELPSSLHPGVPRTFLSCWKTPLEQPQSLSWLPAAQA